MTPWPAACQASQSFTIPWSLLKLMSIESVMPSDHLILYDPLLLLPSIFPSIVVFSNESFLHISWLKSWSFSFSISPSNEYSGLISFRIDWFDLFRQPRLALEYNQPWNHISYLLLQKNKQKSFHTLNVPQSIPCPWQCSYLMLFHF